MSKKVPAPAPPYLGPAAHVMHNPDGSPWTNNLPATRVVVHSTVSACKPGGAREIAAFFREQAAGGSAHYVVDPGEVVQVVYDREVAEHAPPNLHSFGVEMCDMPAPVPPLTKRLFAMRSWRWNDANHKALLQRTANLVAQLCAAYDIPPVYVGPRALVKGKKGVTTHNDVSQAFHQSDHWDPGFWPRRKFMRLVRAEYKRLTSGGAPTPTPTPTPTPAPPPPPPAPTPAPKPKPPVVHKPLNGGNWNVKTGRRAKDVVAAVLDLFATEHLDFLALCEVSTVLKDLAASPELAKAGLTVLGYPDGDIPSRETCIVVRKGVRVTGKNLHDITDVKWERDPANKLKSLHPGRKSVSARVSWLRVLAVHTPPPPFGPAFPLRRKANLDAFAKQTTLLKRWAPSWLAAGDWNRKPADAVAKDFAATLGAEITGSGIDWVAGKGVTVSNVRRVANHGSDHKPVLYTVTKA